MIIWGFYNPQIIYFSKKTKMILFEKYIYLNESEEYCEKGF